MKMTTKINIFLIGVILFYFFYGCTGSPSKQYIKNGKEYGTVKGVFRARWWNYYERALSYVDGEFYQEAVTDLIQAIHQRTKDQRMARTYGMHFTDYFPHRELGIAHYRLGDPEAALRELELSLKQFPSAKAGFYLDRVRKALIERGAKEVAPPRLALRFKTDEIWTREDPVVISGVAEDDHYISGISIGGVPLFLEGSQKRLPFKEDLPLSRGRHTVEVVAKNLMGKATKRRVIIHVDREGPMITLEDLEFDRERPEGGLTISGFIYDEAGVSDLRINGNPVPIKRDVEVFFTKRIAIGKGDLELVAKDRLGNRTSARIPVLNSEISMPPIFQATILPRLPNGICFRLLFHRGEIFILLNSSTIQLGHDNDERSGFHWGTNNQAALCMAGIIDRIFGPKDRTPPNIRLKDWTDTQTVYLEKIYIEGHINDESKIEALEINRIPVLRRKGTSIFFGHMAELKEGKNTIIIEARDEAGNKASKTISIIRRIPKALQLEERLSMTVLPFDQKGESSDASFAFQDNLTDALVNRNRFRVVERERLDEILREQKLSRTKLIDKSTALKVGRLIAAQSITTGSIIETRAGIEIVGRLIDTETSEIMAVEDVYGEVKDLPALKSLAEGMAVKFHRDFPLLDGLVIQEKGGYIFTDLGKDKTKINRRLIIYSEETVKHPVTGKILGADNVIKGRARITQVMPEMSKARLLDDKAGPIKSLDKVITE